MENGSPDEGIEREKRGRRVINPTESKLLEKEKSQGRLLPKTPRSISVLVYRVRGPADDPVSAGNDDGPISGFYL